MTSSLSCWWTERKDLSRSLASFVCPPELVNFSIVIITGLAL